MNMQINAGRKPAIGTRFCFIALMTARIRPIENAGRDGSAWELNRL